MNNQEEELLYLIPTTDDEYALFEDANLGDIALHTRCKECGQSDFITYYIHHKPGCSTAARIAKSINDLPEEKKIERRNMERHL